MNIIALDIGEKRTGVAWTTTEVGVVMPFGVLKNDSYGEAIVKLIAEEKPDRVVVGLPLGLDGSENEHTKKIRNVVASLGEQTRQQIFVFFDERFSSQQADSMGGGVSRDEKAAMVILEGYLESLKHQNTKALK
jgi:putative Holliday junction resolvase